MEIKIKSDGTPTYNGEQFVNTNWYRGLVGKIYPVLREDKHTFTVVTKDGIERWICKSMCEVMP